MKSTARWRIQQAWRFTKDQRLIALQVRIGYGDGREKRLGIGVLRNLEQFIDIGYLYNSSDIHDRNAVT